MRNRRIFISDCEGPISKNDNALELASHFIPNGGAFFTLISRYDDVLASIIKKPGYEAGGALKLILPFLRAYGATNEKIREYSSRNILLVSGIRETLDFVKSVMPSFVVSASYEQYASSLCKLINFPYENFYCTKLDIDKYKISRSEISRLKELREEISTMPMIDIPKSARFIRDFSLKDRKTIARLNEIFWKEIVEMESGRMIREVNPIGGYEKSKIVLDIVKKFGSNFCDVMYVGDSITDVAAFQSVRRGGGLTISFNGNKYAIQEAEIAVLSNNAVIISIFADIFNRFGKERAVELAEEWGYRALEEYNVTPALRNRVLKLYPETLPKVEIITNSNMERLVEESEAFRKTVRGEEIGRLG